ELSRRFPSAGSSETVVMHFPCYLKRWRWRARRNLAGRWSRQPRYRASRQLVCNIQVLNWEVLVVVQATSGQQCTPAVTDADISTRILGSCQPSVLLPATFAAKEKVTTNT